MSRYVTRNETVSVTTAEGEHRVHLTHGVVKKYVESMDPKSAAADAVRWFAGLAADHEVTVHDDVTFENTRRYRVEFVVVDERFRV